MTEAIEFLAWAFAIGCGGTLFMMALCVVSACMMSSRSSREEERRARHGQN